jgi:hypothetical protein
MFQDLIINEFQALVNFFNELNITENFLKPQIKNMMAFIVSMMLDGFHGKLINVSDFALNTTRTPITRFLNSMAWDDQMLLNAMQQYAIKRIWEKSVETGKPIYIIIDDTIAEKTKPSSKVQHPTIAGCSFHRSHLKQETVYGQQFVSILLECDELILPYDTILYNKKTSKIKIAENAILSLPYPAKKGYVLADSWYSCEKLFKAAKTRHFDYIGGMKINRKIFPTGFCKDGKQIQDYVKTLKLRDFDLVTVKGHEYWYHVYVGPIKGMKMTKVIITYPKNAFQVKDALRAFISTEIALTGEEILTHYSKRWPIEVFFRETNRRLGMKQCQVRSLVAVKRYQYMVMLAYLFCGMKKEGDTLGFSEERKKHLETIEKLKIKWVYEQALNSISLEKVYTVFGFSA